MAWELIRESPIVGIGGGNLRDARSRLTGVVDDRLSSNEVIANNVWFRRALLDGGGLLLLTEGDLVLVAAVRLYRRRTPAARFVIGGWLNVRLVSSMITLYFFGVKVGAPPGRSVGGTRPVAGRAHVQRVDCTRSLV